jgi:hypothetical protein
MYVEIRQCKKPAWHSDFLITLENRDAHLAGTTMPCAMMPRNASWTSVRRFPPAKFFCVKFASDGLIAAISALTRRIGAN